MVRPRLRATRVGVVSDRISLDVDPWASADFIVGRDGTIEEANAAHLWRRPLKIIFCHPAALRSWLASVPDYFEVSDVWYYYHVPVDGCEVDRILEHPSRQELNEWLTILEQASHDGLAQ